MDPEEKRKLQRAIELGEENNHMLKKLVRAMRWSRLWRVIYIILIIGSAIGIFYFFQPYIDQFMDTYGSLRESINSFGESFGR